MSYYVILCNTNTIDTTLDVDVCAPLSLSLSVLPVYHILKQGDRAMEM